MITFWLSTQANATVSENWERHVIGVQDSPIYLYVKDMDKDGDLDVASTTNLHPNAYNSEVAWFQNNLAQGGEWEKFIVSSSDPATSPITNANGIVVADIDGDGIDDVAVGTGRVTVSEGTVYWFKAPVNLTGEWQRFQVDPETTNSYFKVYTIDMNKDGMEDILAGGSQGAYLFINPGDPASEEAVWEKISLGEATGSSLSLDDLNGDGKIDIINSHLGSKENGYMGNVSWIDVGYESGNIIFDRTWIDEELHRAFDVNCMDINGDLKKDVLVTNFNVQSPYVPTIFWYEAPPFGSELWTQHIVAEYNSTDIYTGDINNDGKVDLIVSGLFIDEISWFEHKVETGEIKWTQHLIDDEISLPGDIALNDFDGDGDLDIVIAGMGENQIIWYENKIPKPTVCPLEFLLGKDSPHLSTFRTIRDNYLVEIPGGKWMVASYYDHSPEMVGYLKSLRNFLNLLLFHKIN
jgi:hypothetical protein